MRVGYTFDLRFSEWKIQPISMIFGILRACLHEGGGLQVDEVTRLGGVKKGNSPLHAILQPRHPGAHFLKVIESGH